MAAVWQEAAFANGQRARLPTHTGIRRLALVALVLLVSAVIVQAPGTVFDVGAPNLDFATHYTWVSQFAAALRAGDPYPHWMWRDRFGLGEPALLFYSPLFYYACGAVWQFTTNTWEAIRIVFVLSTFLTGVYGWRLLRLFSGDGHALIGAVLLQGAPMIFMLFYYFNDLPWATSFAALVALTYYTLRPGAFERWIDIPVSAAIAALVLAHIVSALMALICFTFMCLPFLPRARTDRRAARRILSWFVSAGAGLLLSMFYLAPAIGSLHLISSQVWTTKFTPWNAFAFPTITAFVFGMRWFSFQWTVPVVVLLGVVAATWRARAQRGILRPGNPLTLLLLASWAALFLASELSYPLWLMHTPLRLVQFPHRFIYVTSATGLLANLLAWSRLRPAGRSGWQKLLLVLPLMLGAAATVMLSAKMILHDGKRLHLAVDQARPFAGLAEYRLPTEGPQWRDFSRSGGFAAECAKKALTCRTLERDSLRQSWRISGGQPSRLRLPLFAFPTWHVAIDGKAVPSGIDPATGLVSVTVPAGTHLVTVSWRRLVTERVGFLITVLTVLMLAVLASVRRLRTSRREMPGYPQP